MTTELTGRSPHGATDARFTSDEFFAMVDADVFPRRPVFLRDGRIYQRTPRSPAHALTATALLVALMRRPPEGWLPWPQNSLRVDDRN
jgi:hypothetical protein